METHLFLTVLLSVLLYITLLLIHFRLLLYTSFVPLAFSLPVIIAGIIMLLPIYLRPGQRLNLGVVARTRVSKERDLATTVAIRYHRVRACRRDTAKNRETATVRCDRDDSSNYNKT